jgi:hypothetical protein
MLRCVVHLIFPEVSEDIRKFLLGLLDLEDGGSTILRNFGKYSPNDTVSHPRRLESSAT